MDEQTWNERARDILRRWLYRHVPPDLGVRQEINALLEESEEETGGGLRQEASAGRTMEERVAEIEAWRHDVDCREDAQIDAIFESAPEEWRPGTDAPSYDLQGIEHRVLVAEGHAVPVGDGWLLKPHRWRERPPTTERETQIEITDEGTLVEEEKNKWHCALCTKVLPLAELELRNGGFLCRQCAPPKGEASSDVPDGELVRLLLEIAGETGAERRTLEERIRNLETDSHAWLWRAIHSIERLLKKDCEDITDLLLLRQRVANLEQRVGDPAL